MSILIACNNDDALKNVQEYTGPLSELDSIVTLYSDSAVVRVKLQAPRQMEFIGGDREFPEGIFIEFFDVNGELTSTLKANKAYYSKQDDLYTGIGDVVVRDIKEDKQLNTEELFWKSTEQRVFTDKFVRIEIDGDILTGEGLTAKQDFSSYKILKPAGTYSIEDPL